MQIQWNSTLATVPSGTKKVLSWRVSQITTQSDRMVDTKTLNKYKCVLASFMSFIHGCSVDNKYDRDYVHSVEALAAVTPQDVVRYMNVKTFGTLFPSPDSNPLSRRGATLGFDKKAIPFSCRIERNGA